MDGNTQIIRVKSGEEVVETLKFISSMILSECYANLKDGVLPKREDYATEEEYQIEYTRESLELIDEVQEVKKHVFTNVLNTYNNFLSEKVEVDRIYKECSEESPRLIETLDRDLKISGIITIGGSLLLPPAAPFLLIINVPRMCLDIVIKKKEEQKIKMSERLQEECKKTQDPLYEFLNTLRSDYHRSNKELKEMKKEAIEGKEIEKNLLPLLDPERVNLPRIEIDFISDQLTEDEIKQLKYTKNN